MPLSSDADAADDDVDAADIISGDNDDDDVQHCCFIQMLMETMPVIS